MRIFDAEISYFAIDYIRQILVNHRDIASINQILEVASGIKSFFESPDEIEECNMALNRNAGNCVAEDRAEYGDFQTNLTLANAITAKLAKQNIRPEFLIEPTCGKGNFLLAAIQKFPTLKNIVGVEIYRPYIWQCKWTLLDYFLQNPNQNRPSIQLFNQNVFDYNFQAVCQQIGKERLLVIGNPPWVTNSKLGALNSINLPPKNNFKKNKGLDAITGKGNFDIAEYITCAIFKNFGACNGHLALLVKNSVIRNILFEQKKSKYPIAEIKEQNIDSKKEFKVSVEASLFCCKLNSEPEYSCAVSDFYSDIPLNVFGWKADRFLSDFAKNSSEIDGKCQFTWRQGIKHDCSKVMELTKNGDQYLNKLNESFTLEEALVYDVLKSSELKQEVAPKAKHQTIITQRNIGEDTQHLALYPLSYQYLQNHKEYFEARKSSIYNGKPPFSIFGIGEYSFKPYKVAISGLYKTFHFTLILPNAQNKPVMLDDTCYMLGFDTLENAVKVLILLNAPITRDFLSSIVFRDAKRMINKEVLMRLDLIKILNLVPKSYIKQQFYDLNVKYNLNICDSDYDNYDFLKNGASQLDLFNAL